MKVTNRRAGIALLIVASVMAACEPKDIHKLKVDLNKAAQTLNTVAKSNRALYEARAYSPDMNQNLAIRIKVATAVHTANEYLISALTFANTLTPETLEGGRAQILALLTQALSALAVQTGKPEIDLAIQSAIAIINNAVILVNAFKGGR